MPSFVLDHDRRIVPILSQARDAGAFDEDIGGVEVRQRAARAVCVNVRAKRASLRVAPPRDELTARERSIVEFIARGRSNKEIARELGVAPETIKTHLKRIFQKLSAESRDTSRCPGPKPRHAYPRSGHNVVGRRALSR